jgi:hypothetical protein
MLELTRAFWESAGANALGTIAGGLVLSVSFFLLGEKLFGFPQISGS